MYYQEILHTNTNHIFSIRKEYEIIENSDEWNLFQNSEDPTQLGFTFEREFFVSDES